MEQDNGAKRRIAGTETDRFTGDVVVFFDDKTAIKIDRREVEMDPLFAVKALVDANVESGGRIDVHQYGRKVGELPAWWTPAIAKSNSFLYDYRDGDLTMQDGKWVAHKTLGASDLDCIIGFVRKDAHHDH